MSDAIKQLNDLVTQLKPLENNHASNFFQDAPENKDLYLGNWFDKIIDLFISPFHGGLLLDSCGGSGCFLTALANAFKNLNLTIEGKDCCVESLLHFFKSKRLFEWNGILKTSYISAFLDVNIYRVPSEIMSSNPMVLNDIIKKGGEIIMKMKSPTGKSTTHFVNVNEYIQETVGDETKYFVMIKETKKDFLSKYTQKIELKEKVLDTRVLLRKDQLSKEAITINPLIIIEVKKEDEKVGGEQFNFKSRKIC